MNAHSDDEPAGQSRAVRVLHVLKLLLTVLVLALTLLRALPSAPL